MANEVKIKVTVDNQSKPGLSAFGADISKMDKSAKEATRSIDFLSDGMLDSAVRAHETARSYDKVGDELATLDRHLATSTAEMRMFASALTDTDDAAQRLDIGKAMSRLQSDITKTTKARKIKMGELIDLTPDPKTIGMFASSIAKMGASAGASVGPVVGSALAAGAAPVVASMLSAAVIGGVGLGGIIGGIALVSKDPRISDKAGAIGKTFMESITSRASVFVEPVSKALDSVASYARTASDKIGQIFNNTSKSVQPLTDSVLRAGDAILGSFVDASKQSGPVLDALGDSIEFLGDGVARAVSAISEGGPEAASNLRLVAGAAGDLIAATGELLGWLNKISVKMPILGGITGFLRKHYDEAGESTDDLADDTGKLENNFESAAEAADKERGALAELTKTLRAQNDPVFALLNAQDKLRSAQTKAAEATRKHGANSTAARKALRDLGISALDLRTAVSNLQGSFDGKLSPAMRSTLRAAGLTKNQIAGLEREFRQAKNSAEDLAGTYKVTVHTNKITTYEERRRGGSASTVGGMAHGGIAGAASGGVRPGQLTWVGEGGPELIDLPPGTQVHPAGTSRNMAERAAGVGPLEIMISTPPRASRDLIDVLIASLQMEIQRKGGNVQNYLGVVGK